MAYSRDEVRQMVRAEAIRQDVDPDLAERLARQESGFNPVARSKAGAIGPMQLMPGTARDLGVDPEDVVENVRGGITYLRQQLTRFGGDTRLALAAYNAGPGAVQKYGGVPPYKETQAYVQAILGEPGPVRPWFAGRRAPAPPDGAAPVGMLAQGASEEGLAPLRVTPEAGGGEMAMVAEAPTPAEATPADAQVEPWWSLLGAPPPAPEPAPVARQDWAALLFG